MFQECALPLRRNRIRRQCCWLESPSYCTSRRFRPEPSFLLPKYGGLSADSSWTEQVFVTIDPGFWKMLLYFAPALGRLVFGKPLLFNEVSAHLGLRDFICPFGTATAHAPAP